MTSKFISVTIFTTTSLLLAILTISINHVHQGSGYYIFIGQLTGFVTVLLISKFVDSMEENMNKISVILLFFPIVTIVISINYHLSLNLINFITGIIPSLILFHAWSLLPVSISLLNKRFDNHFELTIIINKFHKNVEKTYLIPYNSKLVIKYTKIWRFNNTTSYNRLYVCSNTANSQIMASIPIAPLNIKGVQLLSVVMKIFPSDIILESFDYGKSFGGFLTVLSPELKAVRYVKGHQTINNNENKSDNSYEIDVLNDPNFVNEKISNKSMVAGGKLVLLIIWGIVFETISIVYLIFFSFVTYTAYVKWGIVFGVISLLLELILLITIIYSFQKFILWPLGLLIGDINFKIDNEKLTLYYKKFFRSPNYIFPINLNPYLKSRENNLYLEMKSDSSVFFSIKIGCNSLF